MSLFHKNLSSVLFSPYTLPWQSLAATWLQLSHMKVAPKSASPAMTSFWSSRLTFPTAVWTSHLDGPPAWQTQYVQKMNWPLPGPCSLLLLMVCYSQPDTDSHKPSLVQPCGPPPPTPGLWKHLRVTSLVSWSRPLPIPLSPCSLFPHPSQSPSFTSDCFLSLSVALVFWLVSSVSCFFLPPFAKPSYVQLVMCLTHSSDPVAPLPQNAGFPPSPCRVRRHSAVSTGWPPHLFSFLPPSQELCALASLNIPCHQIALYFLVFKTSLT